MKILVTGGTGYIGSHVCVELLNRGHEVVIVDDLSNSKIEVIGRIETITRKAPEFIQINLLDYSGLNDVVRWRDFDAILHFAGLKAVGDSIKRPLKYYENNILGSINLLKVMLEAGIKTIVFSSSATVYGDSRKMPFTEDHPLGASNPYGKTKLFIEEIMRDHQISHPEISVSVLRYFNPVGAHPSGLIGEDPRDTPSNLMPLISKVAIGTISKISVYGVDYPTPDGTCIRDYIHVVDLAIGHVRLLEQKVEEPGYHVYNLGTGKGSSVLQLIKEYESVSGRKIAWEAASRRPGDIPVSYAGVGKAFTDLNWKAERDLSDMCRDSWNWQLNNPFGYANED